MTGQTAIRSLAEVPVMLITEPDVQWWLSESGYDYTYMNAIDHAAMINELQKPGNKNAVLVTTSNKGYRSQTIKNIPIPGALLTRLNR